MIARLCVPLKNLKIRLSARLILQGPCVSLTCQYLFVECCKSLLIKQYTRCFEQKLWTFHQLNNLLLQLKKVRWCLLTLLPLLWRITNTALLAQDWMFKGFVVIIDILIANVPVVISRHKHRFAEFSNLGSVIRLLIERTKEIQLCLLKEDFKGLAHS